MSGGGGYLNIVTFLLTTLFYYMALKPSLPYSLYSTPELYNTYISDHYMFLGIYVALVLMVQFMVNSSLMATKCGGSLSENMGTAGLLTFLPWTLIFGVLVVVLSVYPGFKSAFADVVGYYYVSGSANKLLTELLMNQEVERSMASETHTPEQKKALETAADIILKICGNTSVLINQMVPSNFDSYWGMLKPLMKEQYRNDASDATQQLKHSLFELVVTRDNVGEAMWYMYTGLLLTSIVQLKMTTYNCASNPKTMEANYQKFLEKEKATKEQQAQAQATYSITN